MPKSRKLHRSAGRYALPGDQNGDAHHVIGQVFQVLLLDSENTGSKTGSLRDARNLVITKEQFQAFLDRHASQECLVPEDNEAMKDSYLNLDEQMRWMLCRKEFNSNLTLA